ncbi:MAG: amidohydrolase family protein [Gemmatimonadales bacterium]|nr:amidohydrolase family protein [Gemmatimonadales bacterium]
MVQLNHRPITLFVAAAALAVAVPSGAQEPPTVVAFTNVNVVPMDRERVLANQTVVVRDGRIAEIGPAARVRVPDDALRIDGRGRYLVPGVAEMHAHIPGGNASPAWVERVLFLYLANGVTTIRGMLGGPSHLTLRDRAARGEILSPTIYTSGPSFNGNSATSPEVARRMVEEQRAAGYDFLKIHPGVPRVAFDTMAATAQRVGIRFSGHVPLEVGLERALEARYASIDHLDGYLEWLAGMPRGPSQWFGLNLAGRVNESRIAQAARITREAGVWVVPTEALMESYVGSEPPEEMARWPGMEYLPAAMVRQWIQQLTNFRSQGAWTPERAERFLAIRKRLIRELHAAGVGILLGSDAPQVMNVPGFSIHRELRSYVAAGLTPYQALETGTRNVARFFGAEREFGTVEAGKRADLVLLDADPLADIGNFRRQAGVMVGGRWLPREEVERRLATIAAAPGE